MSATLTKQKPIPPNRYEFKFVIENKSKSYEFSSSLYDLPNKLSKYGLGVLLIKTDNGNHSYFGEINEDGYTDLARVIVSNPWLKEIKYE